eukprot:1159389-Pelagomonas_calceolata.AAC.9
MEVSGARWQWSWPRGSSWEGCDGRANRRQGRACCIIKVQLQKERCGKGSSLVMCRRQQQLGG